MDLKGGSEDTVSKDGTPSLCLAPSPCMGVHCSAGRSAGCERDRLGPPPACLCTRDAGPRVRVLLEFTGVDSRLKLVEMLGGSTFQGRK